jgi:hypothetical protein
VVLTAASNLLEWPAPELDEAAFLTELLDRTAALLLLDLADLHANARNHGGDSWPSWTPWPAAAACPATPGSSACWPGATSPPLRPAWPPPWPAHPAAWWSSSAPRASGAAACPFPWSRNRIPSRLGRYG